jgi:hypothetical protein
LSGKQDLGTALLSKRTNIERLKTETIARIKEQENCWRWGKSHERERADRRSDSRTQGTGVKDQMHPGNAIPARPTCSDKKTPSRRTKNGAIKYQIGKKLHRRADREIPDRRPKIQTCRPSKTDRTANPRLAIEQLEQEIWTPTLRKITGGKIEVWWKEQTSN